MKKLWVHIRWFLIVIPLGLFSLTSYFLHPFAWLMRNFRFNPLWIYLDDTKFKDGDYAVDFKEWLNNRKRTFWTDYQWEAIRNSCWNFKTLFEIKEGKKIVYGQPKSNLKMNGKDVSFFETARWLWLVNGFGGWNTNRGDEINYEKSIIGFSSVYYKIGTRLYYRYSKAWKWHKFFLNFKFGTNDKRYHLTFKIQWV